MQGERIRECVNNDDETGSQVPLCIALKRKVSVVAVYSVTATCDDDWRIAKNHFGPFRKCTDYKNDCICGFSGPQPRETGYCRCRLSKPLITCFANAMSLKYCRYKLLHVKPLYFAKENSLLKTNFASNASWNFADNEVHASWFQSTASREMSVNAARHQGHLPLQPRVTDIIMLITSATLSNRLHVKQRTRSERPTFLPFVVPLFHRTFGSEQATLKNIERMHKSERIRRSFKIQLRNRVVISHIKLTSNLIIFYSNKIPISLAEKKFETTTAAPAVRLHPKPDRLASYDSTKMHFGALELTWRGARDRLQGCKREDDRWKKRRRRMTTELQVWERRKLGHMKRE
ncbi:hypothetical protein ALC60_12428 [Trachymyrmex zeteki]|uniref:Uncharacterized protein n=1 Tax=Mycetomoellerius zeteki TaxID=64791 RepID=A0A151WKW7_9HYME|nr:hypothetical protein ALC60_12428 [Trachymyrmex zeteki]